VSTSKEYEIEQAVRQFLPGQTSERQRNAVYALAHRCALINRNYKPEYQHLFRLTDDATEPLIRWPRTPWNGKSETPKLLPELPSTSSRSVTSAKM
jgi:hypothetical protein